MLVLLVLCSCITSSMQIPEDTGNITVPAKGKISFPCGPFYSRLPPMKLKLQVEMGNNQSWVMLEVKSLILKLETLDPSLLLPANVNRSDNYSCSVDNRTSSVRIERGTELNNVTFDPGKDQQVFCKAPKNWTSLSWSRDGDIIAMVERGWHRLNIKAVGIESSLYITTIIEQDTEMEGEERPVWLNVTCRVLDLSVTGFQIFMEERYWIIVAGALGYVLFCSLIISVYMCMRRKRRAREQTKASFFKLSTARNLYVDAVSQEPGVNQKPQELTYQNVSVTLSKHNNSDCYSEKSSFLDPSEGGDSYLEPITDGGDQVSDVGDCYENTVPETDDAEGSLDGDCYENAGEEIKDGSEGSQSYEDMEGSIHLGNGVELSPEEGITQEEDADSYENMQTPLYTQPNHSLNSLNKSPEELSEERKPSMSAMSPHKSPWNVTTELKEQNGDFYVSYESNKL